MKLRNIFTNKIVVFGDGIIDLNKIGCKNFAEMIEQGWEDYEEPKDFWFIDSGGEIRQTTYLTQCDKTRLTNFGNYFSSKEEAEKAVEKLKAWKRLKDKGFRFDFWYGSSKVIAFSSPQEIIDKTTAKDLGLLFGGEE